MPRIAPRLEAHLVIHRALVENVVGTENPEVETEGVPREAGGKIRIGLKRGVVEVDLVAALVLVVAPPVAAVEIDPARYLRFVEKARARAEGLPRVQPRRFRRKVLARPRRECAGQKKQREGPKATRGHGHQAPGSEEVAEKGARKGKATEGQEAKAVGQVTEHRTKAAQTPGKAAGRTAPAGRAVPRRKASGAPRGHKKRPPQASPRRVPSGPSDPSVPAGAVCGPTG